MTVRCAALLVIGIASLPFVLSAREPTLAEKSTRHATRMTEDIFTPLHPAPTRNCHASTLVSLSDGTVVAAWFGGTKEKNPDVGIWMSRKNEEDAWDAAFQVAKIEEVAHW
jgi:predicted neuraminidase